MECASRSRLNCFGRARWFWFISVEWLRYQLDYDLLLVARNSELQCKRSRKGLLSHRPNWFSTSLSYVQCWCLRSRHAWPSSSQRRQNSVEAGGWRTGSYGWRRFGIRFWKSRRRSNRLRTGAVSRCACCGRESHGQNEHQHPKAAGFRFSMLASDF